MQQYVEQLLNDIRKLIQKTPKNQRLERAFLDEDIENLLKRAPYKPLEDWIGIPKINFPSEQRLSFKQIGALLNALELLLERHGFRVSFPPKAPVNLKYQILVNYLDQPSPKLAKHYWQLSICGYEPSKCQYGPAYCQCLTWEGILNDIPRQRESELICKIVDLPLNNKE